MPHVNLYAFDFKQLKIFHLIIYVEFRGRYKAYFKIKIFKWFILFQYLCVTYLNAAFKEI